VREKVGLVQGSPGPAIEAQQITKMITVCEKTSTAAWLLLLQVANNKRKRKEIATGVAHR